MLNSAPNVWTIESLLKHAKEGPFAHINGKWEPARGYGMFTIKSRLKHSWAVFTGKADALYWPNQPPPKAY